MMVGSLEADIEDVCNVQFDNRDIIDDFDDENADEKTPHQFHKMEVRNPQWNKIHTQKNSHSYATFIQFLKHLTLA